MRWLQTFVVTLLVSSVVMAKPKNAESNDAPALLRRATALIDGLKFEAAIPILERLTNLPDVPRPILATALLRLGVAYSNVARADAALDAFKSAFEIDATIQLPLGTAPKIQTLFDAAKPAIVAPAPTPPPPIVNVTEAPVLPVATAEAPVVAATRSTPFSAGPIVTGVVAAGALGLGIATAVA